MAESEEEVDVLVQRVVKDITNAFKRNPGMYVSLVSSLLVVFFCCCLFVCSFVRPHSRAHSLARAKPAVNYFFELAS